MNLGVGGRIHELAWVVCICLWPFYQQKMYSTEASTWWGICCVGPNIERHATQFEVYIYKMTLVM